MNKLAMPARDAEKLQKRPPEEMSPQERHRREQAEQSQRQSRDTH